MNVYSERELFHKLESAAKRAKEHRESMAQQAALEALHGATPPRRDVGTVPAPRASQVKP